MNKITGKQKYKNYETIYLYRDDNSLSEPHILICWNCESKNTDNDNFCLECGKLLNNLKSEEKLDLNYNKIFNITRIGHYSKEFAVTDNNQVKFKIQTASSPHEKLYAGIAWGLFISICFGTMMLGLYLLGLPIVYNNGFFASSVLIVTCIGPYSPFIIILIIENKTQYNHKYHFSKSEKGSAPEIDLYIDKTRVSRLILGPEHERKDYGQGNYHNSYERTDFQILAQDNFNEDLVLFFATVISNKFKSRSNNPFSKYFAPF